MASGRRWGGWCLLLVAQAGWATPPPRLWKEAAPLKIAQERSLLGQVAQKALASVVALSTQSPTSGGEATGLEEGFGTGFFIHESGYLLTSSHVVEGTVSVTAHLTSPNGFPEECKARVVGLDPETDIALLKIEAPRRLPVLELSTSEHLAIGDWVVLIGNPFGLSQSVTVGVVSYKGRADVIPTGRSGIFEFLQTDAAINPGNSGGPVLDIHGQVVAIANSVNVSGQGIGFATPIELAKQVLPQLQRYGRVRRGWVGLAVQDLTAALAESRRLSPYSGVLVAAVEAASPAFGAGLHPGDVLLSVDRRPLQRAHDLRRYVATLDLGHTLAVRVLRSGEELSLSVRLREQGQADGETCPEGSVFETLSNPPGAKVAQLDSNGPLAEAGVREGDVVWELNAHNISDARALQRRLEEVSPGEWIHLRLSRDKRPLQLDFQKACR